MPEKNPTTTDCRMQRADDRNLCARPPEIPDGLTTAENEEPGAKGGGRGATRSSVRPARPRANPNMRSRQMSA